jgi:hypothetical protein
MHMTFAILLQKIAALAVAGAVTASPFGVTECLGVRPGARAITRPGTSCTFNFLFKGSDGERYIGTAGHCYDDTVEETRTWPVEAAPEVRVPSDQNEWTMIIEPGERIGQWAYKGFEVKVLQHKELDFGLIRLDGSVDASPEMCHFGGPTALNAGLQEGPLLLHHYGNGKIFSSTLRARTAIAPFGLVDPRHVYAEGIALFGDSGGPVIDDSGKAIGLLTAIGVMFDQTPPGTDGDVGHLEIVRLGPQVRAAEKALGIKLRLVTADPL